uniref:Zinc finger CCCH domain-containing protein 65 isoform X2 n=1 Tax=Rhizophora mucronata TaxID=61149 RepID=A0A2P2KM94_RHIMU
MKGEDCPFDHQLSKYPCTNYASKGSCSRGEECMFSHTLPMKGDIPSTSNATASELRPLPSLGASNSKRQIDTSETLHQIVKALPDSVAVISHHNSGRSVPNATWNVPAVVPKGISFLSARKSPAVDSSHPIIGDQSLIKEGFKGGKQTEQSTSGVDSVKVGHQTDKVTSGTVPILNEIPTGTPVALKGINFLSYFRSPVKCSSVNKISCLPINMDDGVKLSLSSTLEKTEPAVARQKPSLFSFGEALSDGSRNNKHDRLPSSVCTEADASAQTRSIGSFKHQNSSAIPAQLSGSPISSAQLSDHLAYACLKNTPSSTQKALMSTLAFASRVGAEMKMNSSSIHAHTGSSGVKERPGPSGTSDGSQNVSAKA